MARRFIVDKENINEFQDKYVITGPEVKHIQVLRFNVGDEVVVNSGIFKICQMTRDEVILEYIKEAPIVGVPNIQVTLYIAFLKSEKMDFVIQKAVEIGVKNIVPFFSSNVIVKLDSKDRKKRREKLQKIADEACKQCGRMDTVEVAEFLEFSQLKKDVLENEKVFFAYEASKDSLRREITQAKEAKFKKIGIVIGAEGGFTPSESQELTSIENVSCVSLGTRILRAETAALNLLSIVIYEMEE